VQGLLKKVSVRANHEYTDEYPGKMPTKITVLLQDGTVIEHDVAGLPRTRFPSVHVGGLRREVRQARGRRAYEGLNQENQGCRAFSWKTFRSGT
jgi:hypothetical protein